MKLKSRKTCSQLARQKRICYTHKKLKTSTNSSIIIEKSPVIKSNQEAWPKSYNDMNTEIRKNAKKNNFFSS